MIKDLKEYVFPDDLKDMDERELSLLAVQIRDFLIGSVSSTGGHLASNLGAVELTIGLHKVFDSPRDRIIWDVGHQSYVHKILTGRLAGFEKLRQTGGMSGFPKRCESEHDAYDTGHSSTSIGAAMGMATARDLKGEDFNVIAVIGDGSLTGGPAFEALNNLGDSGTKVIVVLNDNGMSIGRNTGGLSRHLGRLRTSEGYRILKEETKKFLDSIPKIGPGVKNAVGNAKDRVKYALISGGVIFEELGITYLGPVDGNDIGEVTAALEQAKKAQGPVIVHMMTRKGKGYRPAEQHPEVFHGIGPFDPESGKPLSSGGKSYSAIFGETMAELGKDPRVVAISAAMRDATGLRRFAELYPERFFDVGIAEAHGVIFSAGLAVQGMKPVVAIYSTFLQRAYDEMMEDVCLQDLPVVFAIDRAGHVGQDGETHHGIFDLSYLLAMPNMRVFAPCDGVQLAQMLKYVMDLDGPCAVRYPRGKAVTGSLTGVDFTGSNIVVREGSDAVIMAVGTTLTRALKASDILAERGISCGVLNIGVVDPEDRSLSDVAGSGIPVFTLEDNVINGGFGASFKAFCSAGSRITVMALPDRFIHHGDTESLFREAGLDPESIAERIASEIEREN